MFEFLCLLLCGFLRLKGKCESNNTIFVDLNYLSMKLIIYFILIYFLCFKLFQIFINYEIRVPKALCLML